VNSKEDVTPLSYVARPFAKSQGRVDQNAPKRYIIRTLTILFE